MHPHSKGLSAPSPNNGRSSWRSSKPTSGKASQRASGPAGKRVENRYGPAACCATDQASAREEGRAGLLGVGSQGGRKLVSGQDVLLGELGEIYFKFKQLSPGPLGEGRLLQAGKF